MKPSFVRAAIFLKLLQASMPCGAAEFEPVFVTSSGQSSTGNGVRVAIAGGCATITAAHIIANSATPVVSPPGSGIAPTRVPVDDLDEDIAIIHQKHTNPDDCIPPPSTDVIRKALLGTSREAWTVSTAWRTSSSTRR